MNKIKIVIGIMIIGLNGCAIINYNSKLRLDEPIPYKTKIEVKLSKIDIGWVESESIINTIRWDLYQNVFPNIVEENPDILCVVNVKELRAKYESSSDVKEGVSAYADIEFKIMDLNNNLIKFYHETSNLYKEWSIFAFWDYCDAEDAAAAVLKDAMEKIKRNINRDRKEIIAAIEGKSYEVVKKQEEKPKKEEVSKPIPRFPPDLNIFQITFSEPSKNKALDAYENGEISFVIENRGKGDAESVNVRIVKLAGEGIFDYPKQLDIGKIPSNSQKIVKIPLKAGGDTKDEVVKLRIETYEKFGFDADPFTISFETRKFNPPILTIAGVAVDDDKEGDSYGDNDGIIEPGEQIEVSFAIQNKGIGDANDVRLKIIVPDEGRNLYFNSPSHEFNLGNIVSNGYKKVDFVLTLTRRYNKENILVKAKIEESTGKASKSDSVYLSVGTPSGYGKEITIVAERTRREEEQKPLMVERIDVEEPVNKYGISRENGLCVIIGIEEYKNAPSSLYSNRDAQTFYQYAKDVLGIKERNIYIVTNENATKGEFDKIFGEDGWLSRRVNTESEIFIYFSGHGSIDVKTQKQYLIPYDIDPNYPQTAYSLDKIYESISKLNVKSAVIFIDVCFSGQSRKGELILAGARPLIVTKITEPSKNITLFTATSGSEIASAFPEKKHGLFTYYLLKGLRGEGDLNRDNIITAKELFNYVKEKVSETAHDIGREQTPQLLGKEDNIIVRFR